MLEPAQVRDWWPIAVTDDLDGAIVAPRDGTVNPGDAALALAKGAADEARRFVVRHDRDGVPDRRAAP